MSLKIGIDVGGTFTDLFLWSPDGQVGSFKVLSTPEDPSLGVLAGLSAIAASRDETLEDFVPQISTIVHGTTVTTNAVLTRRGARTGLVTTRGVRDALEMRRGIREEQYDNRYQNVTPLVPRHLRLPVSGRLDRNGRELDPLDLADLRAAVDELRRDGVEAVAICFMNAFANPAHERAASELLRAALPGVWVSASSEVLPTIRFYDRVSTTVLDAYTGPVLGRYLESLLARLSGAGFSGVLLVMQSSGGVASAEQARARPGVTLLSGPAAGPAALGPLGVASAVVVDMGGTSFDVSLVHSGRVALKAQGEIARLRTALPMLDIVTIGAGGGSIGWIDSGGLLRMGPESAGAHPGPACYGRGGEVPACTDADLGLGYLDPERFAGGALRLDLAAARRAIAEKVAAPLGLSVEQAAAGMYRVINANMAHGVRQITVQRGLDPREFPLLVAGGAGALHAAMIARELGIDRLIVPAIASTLCATGMLLSDLAHDSVRTFVGPLTKIDVGALRALVAEMKQESPLDDPDFELALDLRYAKQYHEVTVRLPDERLDFDAIAKLFHAEHDRLYGYELSAERTPLELINVRVRAIGKVEKPALPRIAAGPTPAPIGERRAYLPERDAFEPVPVYDGHALAAGNRLAGPALIERRDTTIFVSPSFSARVDELGSVRLEVV
jgi:N-methylhydantoinase A